jgi:hypothetical protein
MSGSSMIFRVCSEAHISRVVRLEIVYSLFDVRSTSWMITCYPNARATFRSAILIYACFFFLDKLI